MTNRVCTCTFLKDYRLTHPEVTVLDPPGAIQHVYNRQSMLQDVADLDFSDSYGKIFTRRCLIKFIYLNVFSHMLVHDAGTVGVPKQLVIKKDPSSISDAVKKAGLSLPLGMLPFCMIYFVVVSLIILKIGLFSMVSQSQSRWLQSHMSYHWRMMSIPFRSLSLHSFFKSSLTMVFIIINIVGIFFFNKIFFILVEN